MTTIRPGINPQLFVKKPGMAPELYLKNFTEEERLIIRVFSLHWYVTSAREIEYSAKSFYKYALIKPMTKYSQMFGLDRELILIISSYKEFDIRTLSVYDNILEEVERLRIEKICYVVVSKDPHITSKISALLKRDQEARIAIPFTFKELSIDTNSDYLFNRFKEFLFSRDLFSFQAPLKNDLYFFGRTDLVMDTINRHKSGENAGLFGLRKTGKTSVIYGIERNIGHVDAVSVVIDCQNPAFHGRRWYEALHFVVQELGKKYTNFNPAHIKEYTPTEATILFEADINKAYRTFDKKSILLIFDEVENMTFKISPSTHWRDGNDFILFWQSLRAVFQKHSDIFTYLIVGTNPFCVEIPTINGIDNPIFNQIPFQYMPQFEVQQSKEMVSTIGKIMGLNFDEILYSKLTEDFGGHPFLIRQVCSIINSLSTKERPVQVSKACYSRSKDAFIEKHIGYMEMILSVLQEFYLDEYSMLEYLANDDKLIFNELATTSPLYTNHLLGYGIIGKDGDDYYFKIDAAKDYLSKKNKYKKLTLSIEEKWKEISERRNKFEVKLRVLVRNQIRASIGKEEAMKLVLGVFGGERKTKYATHNYEDLFDANKSNIYFEDLRKLIIKKWDVFQNVFGGSDKDIDGKMHIINKHRVEAHAKNITDDEMQQFRGCIGELENVVSEFF